MQINLGQDPYQNSNGVAGNVNADGTVKAKGSNAAVSQDQFMQLLVTQLKNQDPTNPTDQTQMLAQLAQFSSLQQMENLNTTLTAQNSFSQVSQSAALIGKTVTTSGDTATPGVTGIVKHVSVQDGKAYLNIAYADKDGTVQTKDVDSSTLVQIQ